MKKNDIYKLKRCLKGFKTKNNLCLFLDLLSFEVFPKWSIVPPSVGLGFSLCFCFLHLILSIIVLVFLLKIFGSFGFSLSCPSFAWVALMIENFLLCPPVFFGHFQSLRFFLCFSHLPPSLGCDTSQGYFQKPTRLKRGLQRIYFSFVKGLSKMVFLHSKLLHLRSVSLAVMRVCKMVSHYSSN
jgi:hypothetical protein